MIASKFHIFKCHHNQSKHTHTHMHSYFTCIKFKYIQIQINQKENISIFCTNLWEKQLKTFCQWCFLPFLGFHILDIIGHHGKFNNKEKKKITINFSIDFFHLHAYIFSYQRRICFFQMHTKFILIIFIFFFFSDELFIKI